jgi:hypothetical protein
LILPNDHPWFIPTTTTPFGNDTLFKFYWNRVNRKRKTCKANYYKTKVDNIFKTI